MKNSLLILLLLASLAPLAGRAQSPLQMTLAVALDHNTGLLRWNGDSQESYAVFRRYPSAPDFNLVATVQGITFSDTLHRVVCNDTVNYFVRELSSSRLSDTAGVVYRDDIPTAPCSLRLCSTSQADNSILLTWYPSPDTDVMGYNICMGNPCLDYATVLGRDNCSYLCPPEALIQEHQFRILAFDSCSQASPLTPYYHNPVLYFDSTPCSRHFSCRWNAYDNMPDGIKHYCLHYRLEGDDYDRTFCVGPEGPFSFDLLVDDLSISTIQAYLSVSSLNDSLEAVSQLYSFQFSQGQRAEFLSISQAEYIESLPAINLLIDLDPNFSGTSCSLFRSKGDPDHMSLLATLHRQPNETFFSYQDIDVHRASQQYSYYAAISDLCQQHQTTSDTVTVILPEVLDANAYFPNAIRYADPQNGSFRPFLASPLSQGYEFSVFNRMGEQVFHTTQLSDSWDGSRNGSPLPQGTYVYRVHCHHADNTEKTYYGTILLLK